MKGGKLSAPELKGLLDASYDSKVKKVGDFEMDKKLSSSTSKVYRNPVTGQVVVAHRGTAGFTDWGNNAVYALGGKQAYKLTPRYKEAEKVQRRAEKKYGADSVTTIGHSQGGLQSELLGGRSKEIITLNKATLPFESNKNKNQYDIRSERDVVSGLNPFAKKSKKDVNIKAKTYNPLTEHSGDVLNRLGKNKVIGKGVYMKGFGRMRGGASRGRQPPRQPREEEDLPSPEPPPSLRRQILRRLEEIRLKFERDEGSVTFTPEERAILEEERNRLTTILSRMSGGRAVKRSAEDAFGDDEEPPNPALEPEPETEEEEDDDDDDDVEEYNAFVELIIEDIKDVENYLWADLNRIDANVLVVPNKQATINNIFAKIDNFDRIKAELVEIMDEHQTMEVAELVKDYLMEYIELNRPYVNIPDWNGGVMLQYL